MKRALLSASILCLLIACGDDPQPPPVEEGCAEGNLVGDVCAGVSAGKLCQGEGCATADYCSDVILVASDSELQTAVSNATSGTCIVVGPGSYSAVTIPPVGSIQIAGEQPSVTTVSSVTSTGGDDVRVSGITTASVTFDAGSGTLDNVAIESSPTDGVFVGPSATVTVRSSEIRGAARYGVSAFDANAITLDATIIEDNGGPGIWIQSGDMTCAACDCPSTASGTIENTIFSNNAIVGISIVRAQSVKITNVEVRDTTVGNNFEAGGGVSVAYCSDVTAERLRISDSADFGLLVHDATMTFKTGSVDRNLRGVWLQNIGTAGTGSVSLDDITVDGNQGVGIGIAENSTNVSIINSDILHTLKVSLPVLVNNVSAGSEEVGDGLNWLATSQVVLDNVTIGGSERQSILIDGEVGSGSSITNLTLTDGDEDFGVLQQNLPMGGEQPVTSGTAPAVMTSQTSQYDTPLPLVPPGI